MSRPEKKSLLTNASELIVNKQIRSLAFLILSFVFILGINSVLPVVEGDAHYTVEAVETTYGEYLKMKEQDPHYRLVWTSSNDIKNFIKDYIKEHPDLTPEEQLLIKVPDGFVVRVYTKFFYQYPFWYISTITSLASAVILYYAVFNYLITKAKEENREYLELVTELKKIKDQYLDPDTFEPWIDNVFNYNRKIDQHIKNVKYDIERLETRTTYEVKRKFREYYKADEAERAQILTQLGTLTKKELKYLHNKDRLLSLLEPEYIKEFVVDGKVKYFKYISPMFVYVGNTTPGRVTDSYSNIRSDAGRLTKDAASKVGLSLIVTLLFAVLFTVTAVASYQQSPFWIVVNVCAKVIPLLLQVMLAIDYSNSFMRTHLINNLVHRRSISFLYLADMKRKQHVDEEVPSSA